MVESLDPSLEWLTELRTKVAQEQKAIERAMAKDRAFALDLHLGLIAERRQLRSRKEEPDHPPVDNSKLEEEDRAYAFLIHCQDMAQVRNLRSNNAESEKPEEAPKIEEPAFKDPAKEKDPEPVVNKYNNTSDRVLRERKPPKEKYPEVVVTPKQKIAAPAPKAKEKSPEPVINKVVPLKAKKAPVSPPKPKEPYPLEKTQAEDCVVDGHFVEAFNILQKHPDTEWAQKLNWSLEPILQIKIQSLLAKEKKEEALNVLNQALVIAGNSLWVQELKQKLLPPTVIEPQPVVQEEKPLMNVDLFLNLDDYN